MRHHVASSPTAAPRSPGAAPKPSRTSTLTPAGAGCRAPRAEHLFKRASMLHDPHGVGYPPHQLRHSALTHLAGHGVRDSKDPAGPVLTFDPQTWRSFVKFAKQS
ncbi:DUF397 domain-containing protein [Micromonospora sp. NPDC048830]|uniref:DUF397 domain-containing protein n=1 Tax=Micromonospora sp. NPDC048830 TaxID=3364257 RepID=UPI003724462F